MASGDLARTAARGDKSPGLWRTQGRSCAEYILWEERSTLKKPSSSGDSKEASRREGAGEVNGKPKGAKGRLVRFFSGRLAGYAYRSKTRGFSEGKGSWVRGVECREVDGAVGVVTGRIEPPLTETTTIRSTTQTSIRPTHVWSHTYEDGSMANVSFDPHIRNKSARCRFRRR